MLGRFFKKLIAGDVPLPDNRDHFVAAGVSAFRDLDYGKARDAFLQANAIRPLDADGFRMLGVSLLNSGRLDEAELALRAALGFRADNVEIHKMLAMKHLLAGNWLEGFSRYEACRNAFVLHTPDQELNRNWLRCVMDSLQGIPSWHGESLRGKRLMVWSEYGHGDAIMNLRFLSVVRERYEPDEIAFMSAAEEQCLFEAAGGGLFVETEWGWRPQPGEFDFHCSLTSFPYLLKIEASNVPGRVPYLAVPPDRKAAFAHRLAQGNALKVGLFWAGNPAMPLDRLRSLSPRQLMPLFGLHDVEYFSLQKDADSRHALKSSGLPVTDFMDDCHDFMDTAALIENLDIVISVDSAVAHLAGAIGKPVWLLNRFESEWRWMRDREDSVWYPTMRIFNQPESRNWEPVVDKVASELRVLAAARPCSADS